MQEDEDGDKSIAEVRLPTELLNSNGTLRLLTLLFLQMRQMIMDQEGSCVHNVSHQSEGRSEGQEKRGDSGKQTPKVRYLRELSKL